MNEETKIEAASCKYIVREICKDPPRKKVDCLYCLISGIEKNIRHNNLFDCGQFVQALKEFMPRLYLDRALDELDAEVKKLEKQIGGQRHD